jgi:DNA polymerase-3 subunit beta
MATAVIDHEVQAPATTAAFEVSVSHAELVKQLAVVRQAVPGRVTIPIIGNILLHASGDTLTITGTDLDVTVRVSMAAKVAAEGACTVPARKFYDYVKLLPDGDVKIALQDNHWVKVRSGRSNTKMVGLPVANFPAVPSAPVEDFGISPSTLLRLINYTVFSVGDESRYTMNGVMFAVQPDMLEMVSTDGHRLSHASIRTETPVFERKQFLLPEKSVALAKALFDGADAQVFISETAQQIFIQTKTRMLVTRKLSGKFPNYQAVIPTPLVPGIVTSTDAVLPAIERSMLFAHTDTHLVRMDWTSNLLTLQAAAQDIGESEEQIDILGGPEKPIRVNFNGQYLRDALRLMNGAFTFHLKDSKSAGLITYATDDGFLFKHVLMPMGGK